jgi:serine/threonine protein kinase/Flp pilus assembly protein TadD
MNTRPTTAPPDPSLTDPQSAVLRVLEDYLVKLEAGCPPRPEELLAAHPDLAESLRAYLASLDFLHQAARSLHPSPTDSRLVARALEEYQALLAAGEAPDRRDFAARYPAVAGALSECLAGLELAQSLAPAFADDAAVLRLADFRIVREVGRGGMGVVYEAVQLSLGRRVALKILPLAAALDGRQLQRFKHEARAAAQLHHTHIVPVYAVGCERGVHFYAMQYIDGRTLAAMIAELRQLAGLDGDVATKTAAAPERADDRLAASATPAGGARAELEAGPLCAGLADPATPAAAGLSTEPSTSTPAFFRTVARFGVQAAEALEHAHAQGVVHRDIKPANLLVDGQASLWVTDFGLAHVQTDHRLTITGDLVGTLRYMSPEQALARPAGVDYRTDIYSLGATLYELLTLEPAFHGLDRQELLRQIGFAEPKPLRRVNKAVPAELETIVLKAMAKNPAERYATAQELADDLERFLHDEPIRARRPTLVQRARRWARRHEPLIWSAAVGSFATLVVLAGSVGWVVRDRQARQARDLAEARAAVREAEQCRKECNWPQAQAAAKRAQLMLCDCGAEPELAEHVRGLLGELADEEADRRLLAELEAIRVLQADVKDDHFALASAFPKYRETFGDYGWKMCVTAPRDVAAHLRRRPAAFRGTLLTALDHWLILARYKKAPEEGWLERVLDAADTDAWRRAVRAARARDDRAALEKLARDADVTAQPPEELFLLDISLRQRGAKQAAAALLRRAQEAFPGDFWINLELGMALQDCGPRQYQAAIPFLTAAVAIRPDSPGARHNLGLAFLATDRLDDAVGAFRKAIELKADYVMAHHDLGIALARKGRFDEAITAYRTALALNPKFLVAYFNLGQALTVRGRLDEAVDAFQQAIARKPDWAMVHCCLGSALFRKGDLDAALAALHRAVKYDRESGMAQFNLGLVLTEQSRYDKAAAAFRRAADLVPNWAVARYDLGNVLADAGRLDEAVAAYKEAIRLQPGHAEAHCNLANVYQHQGRFALALTAFQRGHELGSRNRAWRYPSAQWVRECRRLVELDGREQALLRGKVQPASAAERKEYAQLCYYKKLYATSARLWADAFTADPKLAADVAAGYRDDAACAAALAGCGRGGDAGRLDDRQRARLRQQALLWLRAELATLGKSLEGRTGDRLLVRQRLANWQFGRDLAAVRDPDALAALGPDERAAWTRLWADVHAARAAAGNR